MKRPSRQRILSLFLVLTLLFSLTAPAFAADDTGGDGGGTTTTPGEGGDTGDSGDKDPDDGETPGTSNPSTPPTITLRNGGNRINDTEQIISVGRGPQITATVTPAANVNDKITWTPQDPKIATVDYNTAGNGHDMYLFGVSPGKTTIVAETTTGGKAQFDVEVSGMVFKSATLSIPENSRIQLVDYSEGPTADDFWIQYFGAAKTSNEMKISSDKPNVLRATGDSKGSLYIDAITEGMATVTIQVLQGGQPIAESTISVTVTRNEAQTIYGNASGTAPLRFSTIESQIAAQCQTMVQGSSNTLASITSLSVSTAQGTLYLNYKSPDDTGSGVGSALTYTAASSARGPYIKDISFVPNPTYTGATATISYTGTAANGRTFKGSIVVTIAPSSTDITLSASPESPAKFTGSAFSEVCQRQTGAPLSYVIFTLPPANQGVIYEGYVSDTDYAARVTATDQYNQTTLNSLTFVPTPGYVGLVSISYAGYSATGVRYNGEVHINVSQSLDESITYNDNGTGVVYFSEADFADYCFNVTGGRLSYVSFTPPASSQGTLYRSWRNDRGVAVIADDLFYANQRVSAIDPITFVAADGFNGTVRIPFAGASAAGVPFTGTVEINVQSVNAGDITYTCTPGGSVKLSASDFNDMCLRLTGQRLHYITFQSLPDYASGAFYHNRTSAGGMGDSVSREARYYNSSAPYIMNLSFWASDSFRGSVEVPFTGCAVSGETFSSVLVITATNSVGGSNTVSYDTDGRTPVTFAAADFDAVSRSATNSALNYLRFTLPSADQGILYFDYDPAATPVAISSTDSLYQGGDASVSKVSFLPAYSYSGTVYIPFSGWAISGAQFQGTVVITVRGGATDTTVRFASRGEPITFSNYAFQNAGGRQPVSIRMESLPAEQEGRLYYQYVCPGRYSWMAAAGTDYRLSGDPQVSSLTFVPRAGFTGRAVIPYTALNADGTTFSGQIEITVDPVTSSAYFNDLPYASAETAAAVDFLFCRGVVNGVGAGKFAPEKTIRRGDFCLMLYRAFQFTADGAIANFSDVPADSYYAEAIHVLRSVGIVNGTGSNCFEPQADISRQDAALMIQRALRAAGIAAPDGSAELLGRYADGYATAGYAQGAMACLIQLDLLPSAWSQLSSRVSLTRADMAVMLHRAMTR